MPRKPNMPKKLTRKKLIDKGLVAKPATSKSVNKIIKAHKKTIDNFYFSLAKPKPPLQDLELLRSLDD